jgi:hypothetical protein
MTNLMMCFGDGTPSSALSHSPGCLTVSSIPITKKPAKDTEATYQPDLLGLRDRALIAIMVYSFARIGAVI